jgi:hypothetical protein
LPPRCRRSRPPRRLDIPLRAATPGPLRCFWSAAHVRLRRFKQEHGSLLVVGCHTAGAVETWVVKFLVLQVKDPEPSSSEEESSDEEEEVVVVANGSKAAAAKVARSLPSLRCNRNGPSTFYVREAGLSTTIVIVKVVFSRKLGMACSRLDCSQSRRAAAVYQKAASEE